MSHKTLFVGKHRFFRPLLASSFMFLMVLTAVLVSNSFAAEISHPRIVNIYNFIRNSDYRISNSEDTLFEATQNQIELFKKAGLPATYALQYDALINPRYQKLLKEQLGTNDEIGVWWEIPQPLVEKAGLNWRGNHEWVSTANIAFSPGYTPEERRKLVDVYMGDFKAIFGYYPRSAGSWYIDEVTLDYMVKKYGIVASCNCKDQVGTDGYTLWGGYWNQAYYPSRLNSYMPAQTKAAQINVPVFRMLGSDPIYQHGTTHGMWTLEPVYRDAGGSTNWVEWFMGELIHQPSLAFAFTQAGQENSFGWDSMKKGLTLQADLMSKQAKAGEIQVMTLAQAGAWFQRHHSLTPATSMVALEDWKNENRKTVWYNSRFYRLNLLWENNGLFIRDLHRFDEKLVSPTHDTALLETSLEYGTLPIMDGARWSGSEKPGIWPVLLADDGSTAPMVPEGKPIVKEVNKTDLNVIQPLRGGGTFSILLSERQVVSTALDGQGKPLRWAWHLVGGDRQKAAVKTVTQNGIRYHVGGMEYQLRLAPKAVLCQQLNTGVIRIAANDSGKVIMTLDADN